MAHLKRDDRGATAIEYAIIAGLIGLGLVGSLVTTRGSLSAIFGTAGSQMASGVGSSSAPVASGPQAAQNPLVQTWSTKTIASTTLDTDGTRRVSYTDGSSLAVSRTNDAPYVYFFQARDASKGTMLSYFTDANRVSNGMYMYEYFDFEKNIQKSSEIANLTGSPFVDGVPTFTDKRSRSSTDAAAVTSRGAPSASYLDTLSKSPALMDYFLSVSDDLKSQGR